MRCAAQRPRAFCVTVTLVRLMSPSPKCASSRSDISDVGVTLFLRRLRLINVRENGRLGVGEGWQDRQFVIQICVCPRRAGLVRNRHQLGKAGIEKGQPSRRRRSRQNERGRARALRGTLPRPRHHDQRRPTPPGARSRRLWPIARRSVVTRRSAHDRGMESGWRQSQSGGSGHERGAHSGVAGDPGARSGGAGSAARPRGDVRVDLRPAPCSRA